MRNPLTDCPGCGAPIGENCLNVSTECRVRIRQSTTASKALAHLSEGEHMTNQIIDCPGCGTAWGSKCHDLSVQCYMRADYKIMAAGHRTAPAQPAQPLSDKATLQRARKIMEQEEHQLAISKEAARKEFLGEVDKISPKFISPQEIINAATHGSQAHMTTDSQARKQQPIATGVIDYFPDALADVARLSKIGNDKHNPGQPLHWSRGKSDDHADCIVRHMVDRGTVDTDGVLHDIKVAWRALAQAQLAIEKLRKAGVPYGLDGPIN